MKTPAPQRAAGRKKLAKAHDALADGSFPIPDVPYLKKAIRAVGRAPASKRPALKALIRRRARELGALNEPGVKGTWAFANDDGQAIEMATMTGKMPKVRGAADVTLSRSGPGSVTVMHTSTGTKVGTLDKGMGGWQATHRTGKKLDPAPTMAASMNGLIGYHNKLAASAPTAGTGSADMAADGSAVSLATSAATSSDGPRVTAMSGGKKATAAPAASSMSAEVAKVYAKLIKKGLSPKQAAAFAKRAAAMHAKDAAKAAAA